MNIDSKSIISVTEANQNFTLLTKLVEKDGQAIIFKRNKPRYMMIDINNSKIIDKAYVQLKNMSKEMKKTK